MKLEKPLTGLESWYSGDTASRLQRLRVVGLSCGLAFVLCWHLFLVGPRLHSLSPRASSSGILTA